MIEKYFKLVERKTSIKTELLAGVTTFLSMAYILFVNPSILGTTGMDQNALFVATALAAAIGTLIMGVYANYPVAQAPGMGMNAFFAFNICGALGYHWSEALFAIFVSGMIFMTLAASGLREMIINAIPSSLKYAVSAGVGLFIAFIGLKGSGIVVANEATIVSLGNLKEPAVLLAIFGIILTLVLMAAKVKGSIFIGMVCTTIVGILVGLIDTPTAIVSGIPSLEPIAFKLFNVNIISLLTNVNFWFVIFSVLFLDFFDTAGTLMGVATRANLLDEKGRILDADKALMADATATTIGAMLGTSSVTSYGESIVGIESGGRTGLTSVSTTICFLLALFFSPLLLVVTSAVTAPALITVGALMMASTKEIDFDDFADTSAAFFTMLFMVLAYSIAEGIAVGFIMYVILKVASKEAKKIHPIMYGLSILFVLYFIFK